MIESLVLQSLLGVGFFPSRAVKQSRQVGRAELRLQSQLAAAVLAQIEAPESFEGVARGGGKMTLDGTGRRGPEAGRQHANAQIDAKKVRARRLHVMLKVVHVRVGHGHVFEHALQFGRELAAAFRLFFFWID